MAIIVKIDWRSSRLNEIQERRLKSDVERWRVSQGVPAFISMDDSIIITDISEKTRQFGVLQQILRGNFVNYEAVGNVDLHALADAAIETAAENQTQSLSLFINNNH